MEVPLRLWTGNHLLAGKPAFRRNEELRLPAGGSAHDLLGEDDYLESITFSDVTARADESWNITFLIDSITINLKQK